MKSFLLKKISLFALALGMLVPGIALAQSSNVGIIKGMWFSADEYFVGDTIRVYTAIQNNSGEDVVGSVEFFDNGNSITTKSFVAKEDAITQVWAEVVAQKGARKFSAIIREVKENASGATVVPRTVESDNALDVDNDTDGDDIGDEDDPDDDNDGFTDAEEKSEGTDPLDQTSTPTPPEPELVDNDTQTDNQEKDNLLAELVKAISGSEKDNNETKSENEATSSEPPRVVPETPFVTDLVEKYPAVSYVTNPINRLQNVIVPRVQKAEETNASNRSKVELERSTSPKASEKAPEAGEIGFSAEKTSGFKYQLLVVWSWILCALEWLFSSVIIMIILLFIVFYLLLRFIFRFIGRRFGRR